MRGEEFGTERLKEVVETNSSFVVKKIVEKLFSQIEKFTLDNRKYDDQTVVALKVTDQEVQEA